eukprot:scaffold744_cov111-Isochrysis_galbana.AAC.9
MSGSGTSERAVTALSCSASAPSKEPDLLLSVRSASHSATRSTSALPRDTATSFTSQIHPSDDTGAPCQKRGRSARGGAGASCGPAWQLSRIEVNFARCQCTVVSAPPGSP